MKRLWDLMWEALEMMDEGIDPIDYLYDMFSGSANNDYSRRRVMSTSFRVVEHFYANYF